MNDQRDVAEQLRLLHSAPLAHAEEEEVAAAQDRALGAALAGVHAPAPTGNPARRHSRARRTAVLATLASAAVFAAIALAPDGEHGGREPASRHVPSLTASASAAEALAWAGDALEASGGAAGSGSTWHGTSSAYLDGKLTTVTEQWIDPAAATYLAAAWGEQRTADEDRALLKVVSIDDAGTANLRTYEKPTGADAWRVPEEPAGPHTAFELPEGYGAGQRGLADATQAWLTAVEGHPGRPAIVAATRRFSEATQEGYFGGEAPEMARGTLQALTGARGRGAAAQREIHEQVEAGRTALRIRPVLFLLTTVQATPEATSVLYGEIAQLDTLERLSNVTVGGREVIRIRFDPVEFGTHRERVLVIDGRTGAPLRTESVNRMSWTIFAPARRVEGVGAASELCDHRVPCNLLRGTGTVADSWDTYLDSTPAVNTVEMFRDPSFVFITATELRPADDDDSAYGTFTGECSRDARTLSVCRG